MGRLTLAYAFENQQSVEDNVKLQETVYSQMIPSMKSKFNGLSDEVSQKTVQELQRQGKPVPSNMRTFVVS